LGTSLDTPPPKVFYQTLDEKYYDLNEEQKRFFKKETGIQDDTELKKHITAVQAKAFTVGSWLLPSGIFLEAPTLSRYTHILASVSLN
jgi:hypothetical protein